MPAKVPATSLTWKARAVPMPWAASPAAKPRARMSRIRRRFIIGVTRIAPMMPVRITRIAVSVGSPPSASAMPIATPEVTDFGASETRIGCGMSRSRARPITTARVVAEPAARAASMGARARRTVARRS